MSPDLHLVVCENFIREAKAIVEAEGLTDVTLSTYPARCGRPPVAWTDIAPEVPPGHLPAEVLVFGGQCLDSLDGSGQAESESPRFNHPPQCFDLLINEAQVDAFQKDGAYLVSPGWLSRWRSWVAQWGFDQALAREFFAESTTSILLLDTGIDSSSPAHLKAFAAFIDRPSQRVEVGLTFYRLVVTNAIYRWRLEAQKKQSESTIQSAQGHMADYALAMELLSSVARTETEDDAIDQIMEMFAGLCAPDQVHFLPYENGQPTELRSWMPHGDDGSARKRLAQFRGDVAITKSGGGFRLRIGPEEAPLAALEVEGLAYPENIQDYANIGLAISDTCALALNHGLRFQQIAEAKEAQETLVQELQLALSEIRTLSGFIPICAHCKKIRDDEGYWQQVEKYVQDRSEAQFSHGICPDCVKEHFPDLSNILYGTDT